MILGMTSKQFVEWMKIQGLRVSDVASATKLDPNTIYAYRRGESVRRTTIDILLRFVSEYKPVPQQTLKQVMG